MPGWSRATRAAARSPAGCAPNRWRKPTNGSTTTNASGANASINSPPSWRKTHAHHHQAQSHHQAPVQRGAGESLRCLDRPGKGKALDRAGRRSTPERESLVTITFKADGGGTVMTL